MKRKFVAALASLVLVFCAAEDHHSSPPVTVDTAKPNQQPQRTAEATVEEFGRRVKQVSTLAPADVAKKSIRDAYSGFVTSELLDVWTNDPSQAPGRQTSSPWPDRIEVTSTSNNGDRTIVKGELVEATSSGDSGRTPITLELQQRDGEWLIAAYQKVSDEPANVVTNYYAAIAQHRYKDAFAMWGSAGPRNQTYDAFVAGFRDTADVSVSTGEPSRIEGAAGSHYVDVPVRIIAKTTSGASQRFEGKYVLRRSVVDGAPERDRQWHLYSASIHQID